MNKRNILLLALAFFINNAQADIYKDMFISYFSPTNVYSLTKYVKSQKLGGYIFWDLRSDLSPADKESLLGTLKQYDANAYTMAYWPNSSVYADHAYSIPGSKISNGHTAINADMTAQLAGGYVNHLAYAFLEAQTIEHNSGLNEIGTLYFIDPWADLSPSDPFCRKGQEVICSFVSNNNKQIFSQAAYMGNFEAFSNLKRSYRNLKTAFSIGGYGHNETFESILNAKGDTQEIRMSHFINSAVKLMKYYNIDSVDLDYENPHMSIEQSTAYLALIQKLNEALTPLKKTITVTLLANQDYLLGRQAQGREGFAPNVLEAIAKLAGVEKVNLMTYDFHGAFDYQDDHRGLTGFLSNLVKPSHVPPGYDPKFSINLSVTALRETGVPAQKINVGIPAYGRALTHIPAGKDNTGLFQPIPAGLHVIPRGDLDGLDSKCSQQVPLKNNACSGSFSYRFIMKKMYNNVFKMTSWADQAYDNGTTGYASLWDSTVTCDAGYRPIQVRNGISASNLSVEYKTHDGKASTASNTSRANMTHSQIRAICIENNATGSLVIKTIGHQESSKNLAEYAANHDITNLARLQCDGSSPLSYKCKLVSFPSNNGGS